MMQQKYSKHVLVLLLVMSPGISAFAQTWAAAPASLARDPNQDVYGSGIASMSQGCGWGSNRSRAVDDYSEKLDEMKIELKRLKVKNAREVIEAEKLRLEIELKLGEALMDKPGIDPETFVDNTIKCAENYAQHCANAENYADCLPKVKENFKLESAYTQCACAIATSKINKKFEYANMCVTTSALTNNNTCQLGIVVDGLAKPGNLKKCETAAAKLERYQALKAKADKFDERYSKQEEEYEKQVEKVSGIREKQRKLRDLERQLGDDDDASGAGVRDCVGCKAAAIAMMQRSADINKLGWFAAGSTLLESGIRAAVDIYNGKRNAALGYPTGPAPWVPSAMNVTYGLFNAYNTTQAMQAQNQMGYGYPLAYGGVYGANQGGMGAGSIGCSPMIYGAQGFPNGPIQNNNGGGIYMPGYIPNYGYAGVNYPGGMPPQGMMMPGIMGGGMGGGFMGPGGTYMGGQFGGGFNPMAMVPGMAGFGGPGMMGMGGLPMFSQGGYPGYGSAGTGGINIYGGAGIPGLFGLGGSAGMGYNPYGGMMGASMASPYGMYGMQPGMGGMAMGASPYGMYGMPGMYGMNGMGGMGMGMGGMGMDYQMQMMNAQMQAMQDYNRRYMQATQTFTQAAQLQQQAYSILYGGGGGGVGMAPPPPPPGVVGGTPPGSTPYNYTGAPPASGR